jgi:transposase
MGRRSFTWEFKVEAVRLVRERGVSFRQAGADLGIHENMLRKWAKDSALHQTQAFPGRGKQRADDAEVSRRLRDLRARHSVARAAAAVLSACLCTHVLGQTAAAGWNGAPPGGIWKAAVPPTQMKGEFDNFDPIGIAAGARIKADCSINWIDPDDGARYCFSSGTSLEFFLDDPQANTARARAGWLKLNH